MVVEEGEGGNRHRFNVSKGATVEGWRLGTTSQTFIKKIARAHLEKELDM